MSRRCSRRDVRCCFDSLVALDQANKGGAVRLLHATQGWIVDANSVWSGNTVARYNRGVLRLTGWTSPSIMLQAVCTPQTAGGDGQFAVFVDGVFAQAFTVSQDAVPRLVAVNGLDVDPVAGSTVEVWEAWQIEVLASLNSGADQPVEGAFLTGVYVPHGQTVAKPTTDKVVVIVGDSIIGFRLPSVVGQPQCLYGVGGQLRELALALGAMVVPLDYGGATLCGDGLTAADYVQYIEEAVASVGTPSDVTVLLQPCLNDYYHYGTTVSSTPTDCRTFLQAIVDGLDPAWTKVIVTPVPQGTEGANSGGYTLPNYRTAIALVTGATIVPGTSMGLAIPGDYAVDQVHFNDTGVAKEVAAIAPIVGLA